MNNKQLYLAWLRTYAPTVYAQAVRNATGQKRNLGGLQDDLLRKALAPNLSHSFLGDDTTLDPITVTGTYMDASQPITTDYSFSPGDMSSIFDSSSVAAPNFNVGIDSGGAVGLPAASAPAASSTSTWTNILAAVTTIGAGVLTASNQNKLISLNTTRANQGLPPVDATGRVVSPYGVAPTSSALLNFEKSISGATGSMMMPVLVLLGVGAFILSRKKSA